MTVQELIDLLEGEVKKVDRSNADIQIFHIDKDQQYEIKSMGGFSLSPDIVIHIKEVESPLFTPARFKKEHTSMINRKIKEIENNPPMSWIRY